MLFTNQVALITGGSAGIGLAVARKWVAAGGRAALVARTQAKLDEAVASLGGAEKAAAFALDVGDLDALAALPGKVAAHFGRLDVVINNAGAHHRGPLLQRTAAQLAEMVLTNLTAPIVLTRAAAEVLPAGGAIVNVASLAGMVPVTNAATYSATKAGLRAFSSAVGEELRAKRITVATVSPGPVDTDFFGDLSKAADIVFSQPMSTPDQVAAAILKSLEGGSREVAMPWFSGKLATLGYLSPSLSRVLQPMLTKLGARKKAAYAARRAKR